MNLAALSLFLNYRHSFCTQFSLTNSLGVQVPAEFGRTKKKTYSIDEINKNKFER